jgi:hypothetical protein
MVKKLCCCAVLTCLLVLPISARGELQNVVVGGKITIRGNYWRNSFNSGNTPSLVRYENRVPPDAVAGRPIGSWLGGQTITSHFDWDNRGADYRVVEQRTRLHIRSDFTDNVWSFIELDSFDVWGEDFRSNYVTGVDRRAVSADDVEVYQAFIACDSFLGLPVDVRIGRQELVLGSGWLVGDNSGFPEATGLSFDGIRATYRSGPFEVDAFWTKLAERSPVEEDGDTDFSGVTFRYLGLTNATVEAYWLWLRDAQALHDTQGPIGSDWFEHPLGLDDYDATNLHTVGLRAAGNAGQFDFEANAAYQFGDAGQVGFLFKPLTYGDDSAEFDAWAGELTVGYTVDTAWQPRLYVSGAYVQGEDDRDITFWEWLNPLAPLMKPDSSVSFNRLFSNRCYSYFIDEMGELSNFWTARVGVQMTPSEPVSLDLCVAYLEALEPFDAPVLPLPLSFITKENDTEIGWESTLRVSYRYSADLVFEAGWSHLFTGDGLSDGTFTDMNGLMFGGGTDDNDADYFFVETRLAF